MSENLRLACEATLLFHSGSPWDADKRHRWLIIAKTVLGDNHAEWNGFQNILSYDATTKTLCDIQRTALKP